ncbi:aldehyde dehydrogenase family protein [Acidothermaceae bacterium B102]|nr:aldehyde dehydrogenase family protein [Acidothermaceae bacterium B102]
MSDAPVIHHFIHGAAVESSSGDYFDSLDPATGSVVARVAAGNAQDVDAAVHDARSAAGSWADVTPVQRAHVLFRIAAALRAEAEPLALAETLDNGKPLSQARSDVESSARYFEYYAGAVDKLQAETIPMGPDYLSYTRFEPYGVTAQVIPWNAPLQQAARGFAPALAAGNTIVAKPAEDTSLTCVRLAEIASRCGLPDGVLNVVTGLGEVTGDALVRHPEVDKIAFTGSLPTGQLVMKAAADRVVPVTLELGGKSPNIVFADADLDSAAAGAIRAITLNAGQICSAGSRLLVHRSVHDEVVQRLVALSARVTVGPGVRDPDMGPLTTEDQWRRVRGYLDLALEEGTSFASGGKVPTDSALRGGWFVEPTIVVGVASQMRIAQEEIFGPVLCVIPFDDDAEAVQIANDTDFGLVAGIWTTSLSRAHRVAAQIKAGQVFVNEYFAGGVETPFGGYKRSGIGREKGLEGLRQYLQVKSVTVRI